jgi:hypothetical protein
MSSLTYIVDSTSTTRKVKKLFVVDSGSVTRRIKKGWIIDSSSVARLIFTSADFLTLVTAGAPVAGSNGYIQSSFGSLTPTTLGDGSTVTELAASVTTPFPLNLTIRGYPGTITSAYLTSLTLNAATFLATSATFSGGSPGGSAVWNWASGFHFSTSETVAVVLQRT